MSRKDEYFARYEAIVDVSGRMLVAARDAAWHSLSGLQAEYLRLVDGLRQAEEGVLLDDAERRRKFELIRRILADDAAIRDLAAPEVARLAMLIHASRSTLNDLYRARG
ncbi:flagellar biosynthesis protein FliT [Burkholderia singularis]|uniref:Flagellar protein FliT n=1 Tax=Burkholderia singularis TaxID=1503053 RepID=A0A103E1P7_9BURK|nr:MULTISPECIES: flagellar protein FliT [Burkholderia]AOK28179.1 flagellar biosynthesis protein FliT [Burkholderia sp. Bp7605]KVE26743.1 flagellar biosynthesis protein FliT [Burkholderia singularis]SMG01502.1 Flagellar biosynthesis protein FliT [Burkholderia singularis]